MLQLENHVFTGMQQDTSVSKHQPEYLIDAHNIRITAREGETLLSVTNERGPKELVIKNSVGSSTSITGTILGHCVLNNYLVLFTHNGSNEDSILRIDMSGENPVLFTLFSGNLGFDLNYPIEAISDYENENIQKVYWTDGKNQPRVINIKKENYLWNGAFDFVPSLQLNETAEVVRNTNASGQFPAGVIQYAFSYYNKYGQESNIFHVTPLYYTSFYDRGGSPEASVSNAFTIKVSGVDTHFDYLRIYSIQRTSLNATPICKIVQDIAIDSISGNTASYVDTGTNGNTIDPQSLLFIGGEEIVAQNICSKDGTLFLGNIELIRPNISTIKVSSTESLNTRVKSATITTTSKSEALTVVSPSYSSYFYVNGLNTQAAGFKNREYYRVGIQAQYKNGKWSEPLYIKDHQVISTSYPSQGNYGALSKLIMASTLDSSICTALFNAGYRRIRPVVVFPEIQDRTVLCQGVLNPTMYTSNHRNDGDIYAQSSWFFRPWLYGVTSVDNYATSSFFSTSACSPFNIPDTAIPYASNVSNANGNPSWNPKAMRGVEIQGHFDSGNQFKSDWNTVTFHSPDIVFEEDLQSIDLTGIKCRKVGLASITKTSSNIDIQTNSPTISNGGSGFIQKSFTKSYANGIISGLYYDDYLVDDYDSDTKYEAYSEQHSSCKWMVFAWHKNGSFNNDVNRPSGKGVRSAELKKKVISNLRYANTVWNSSVNNTENLLSGYSTYVPQLFSSDEVSVVKLGDSIYEGNIDTLLSPDANDGIYFAYGTKAYSTSNKGTTNIQASNISTDYTSESWWKTWSRQTDAQDHQGVYKYIPNYGWERQEDDIADKTVALASQKEPVRMKYKSTPHIVLRCSGTSTNLATSSNQCVLPIVELYRDYNANTAFGGQSQDALRANNWLPAGKAMKIAAGASCTLNWEWGDTWFSRYDCLKTHSFTLEDPNQIVEIGSFLLETRVNIDGRYDRNRGQVDNTNMSPRNFNLFNPVYSQRDNFFMYHILDDDYYKLNQFPNQITWSTEKSAGEDIDPWTSVTLASTYNMDGSKGQIRSLNVWSDNIYCFQDNGVCNILFNSRVQIPTSDGVPIEIANNYKVDGKRYISDGVGCVNKFSICPTPMALYFIDSVGGHLQSINGSGLGDLSLQKNMVTWLGKQDTTLWTPNNYTTRVFYDTNNKDIYIVTKDEALCYSEILGQFTSFMSYESVPVMFNVVDRLYCLKNNYLNELFQGDYNYFFGEFKGFDFTFVSNGKGGGDQASITDKIFSVLEFRADKWSDKLDSILSSEPPFDYLRVWNEYQDTGEVLLHQVPDKPSILKKKFRIWRAQIPRDAHNRRDRIRNTWCKVKLGSAPRYNNGNNSFVQLHDAVMQYFA